MPRILKRFKRFLRKITCRPEEQPVIPQVVPSASTTPGNTTVTGSNHAQQEQPRDGLSSTPPIPPAAPSANIISEDTTVTGSNHAQQEQPRGSSPSSSPTNPQQPSAAQSLWDRAYDALAKNNPDLVKKYDALLVKEAQSRNSAANETTPSQLPAPLNIDISSDRARRQVQLNTVIENGLQRMENNKATYNFAGHEFIPADQVAKAAKFLLWGKALIDTAVKVSPEASLAWSGVCLILPLLTNPTVAAEANRNGFAYVTSRMRYYVALEPMVRQLGQNDNVNKALILEANNHIVDLYQVILEFQLTSVLRFYRSPLKTYARDIVTSRDWEQTLLDIKTQEQIVNGNLGQINDLAATRELEHLYQTSKKMSADMESYLSVAAQQLDVLQKQLAAQEDANLRGLLAEQRNCLQAFYPTPNDNSATYDWYKGRVERRVKGTCNWFLQHDNYLKWLSQESGPLLVSADPGCGKSVLAKYLIDHELAQQQQSATICYFFFKDQDQNTIRQALSALLHQLFRKKSALIQHAMKLYNEMGKNLVESEESLWTILGNAVRDPRAGPVIFVIDALDECAESQLGSLITNLEDMFSDQQLKNAMFKVLMTSRPYDQVVTEFYSLQDVFPRIHIPGEEEFEAISQEINSVINHRVEKLAKKHRLSDEIKSSLNNKLLAIDHRTYLWVHLVFDYLEKGFEKTDDGIDAAIQNLPRSVNQAYDQILNRSQNDDTAQTVKKALSIILAARRPLTLSEMNIAMKLNGQGRGRSIYDLVLEKDEDFKTRLRTLCGLFVNIHHDKVYFLHQTAREFLIQSSLPTTVSSNLQWHHSIHPRHAHSVLAEICMLYLDMLNSTPTETFRKDDHQSALLRYSVEYWGDHCREANFKKGSAMVDLALGLCAPDLTNHSQWVSIIFSRYIKRPKSSADVLVAAHVGITPVTEILLSRGADIEAKDIQGWTALVIACRSSYEDIIRLLVEKGADVDAKGNGGVTALSFSAFEDREDVARLLLENGADVEARDGHGWTALMPAALFGHEAVARLLLEKGADVEAKSNDGRTAFIIAARAAQAVVTQLLLEKGADVEAKDNDGKTALLYAADAGHEAITRLLLEKGANVAAKTNDGWTALIHAAESGHETVTRLLLQNGADVKAKKNDGGTALMAAVLFGHEDVARLLLEKGADVEAKTNDGSTALIIAAKADHEVVTQLLLEKDSDNEAKGYQGVTATKINALKDRKDITRLLLDNGADAEAKKNDGSTALMAAALFGHEAVARLLIEKGANVAAKDNDGKTALNYAASNGHEAVTRLLLDNGAKDV